MEKSFVKGRWKIGVFIREWGVTAKSERGKERKERYGRLLCNFS